MTPSVTILGRRPPVPREGWIDAMRWQPHRVDVDLTLDDGTTAEACLSPSDAEWFELCVGQIVWVDVLPALPCSVPAARVIAGVGA